MQGKRLLPCRTEAEALLPAGIFNSPPAPRFRGSLILPGEKRPVGAALLKRLSPGRRYDAHVAARRADTEWGDPRRRGELRPMERIVNRAWADVAVVGGGPAGALAARQLAGFGFDVALAHLPRRRWQHLGESLSASAPRLLGAYGLELPPSVYAPRPADHFVRWAGREDRIAAQPGRGGGEGQRLLRRDRLDAWLLGEARRAGVRIVEAAAAGCSFGAGAATLRLRSKDGTSSALRAAAVVDASGRSGALTRGGRERPGFRTTALTRHFPSGPRTGTLITSFPDGWVWSAPVVGGLRDVTVMVDAETAADPEPAFAAAVREGRLGGFVNAEDEAGEAIRAADVTPVLLPEPARRPAGVPLLAVGDAASALDPLTGLGTMKAMDSGLTAAIVIRTALERPADAGLALDFHNTRERGLAAETGDRIAAFYAEETRYADRRFWRRRSRAPAVPPPRPVPLSRDAPLVAAPDARIETRGLLEGDWIVPAEVLTLPGRRRPAHRFGPVHLPELFRRATAAGPASRVPATFSAGESAALAFLLREGFLIPRPPPAAAAGCPPSP